MLQKRGNAEHVNSVHKSPRIESKQACSGLTEKRDDKLAVASKPPRWGEGGESKRGEYSVKENSLKIQFARF